MTQTVIAQVGALRRIVRSIAPRAVAGVDAFRPDDGDRRRVVIIGIVVVVVRSVIIRVVVVGIGAAQRAADEGARCYARPEAAAAMMRSEERRVGKECRDGWAADNA